MTSLGGPVGGQVVFVSLFSVANACGRLLFGHVSEHFLHALGTPRTTFLALAGVLSLSTTVALGAGAPLKTYYVISLLMGEPFSLRKCRGLFIMVALWASELKTTSSHCS